MTDLDPDQIEFALVDSDPELATPTGMLPEPTVVLGAAQVRIFAFTSSSLAVLITITPMVGSFRVDGWLAPGAALQLELRYAGGTQTGYADDGGRFDFADVPAGTAQLVVHPTAGSPVALRTAVITPTVEL